MSDQHDNGETASEADKGLRRADGSASTMPRLLQEQLAQKLRSAYQELAPKPAFLGDPAIPVEFEHHLQRLEAVEKQRHSENVRKHGLEAVKSALEDIVAAPLDGRASEPGQRLRRSRT